jgi:hypothetical protein
MSHRSRQESDCLGFLTIAQAAFESLPLLLQPIASAQHLSQYDEQDSG